jgi:hypothetical protein
MGLIRSAIVGPLVLYAALMGHTFCHMWLRTPDPLVAPKWTAGESAAQKDDIVADRQELIKEIKQAVGGTHKKDFPRRRLTDDVVFEDFWMRYEVSLLLLLMLLLLLLLFLLPLFFVADAGFLLLL